MMIDRVLKKNTTKQFQSLPFYNFTLLPNPKYCVLHHEIILDYSHYAFLSLLALLYIVVTKIQTLQLQHS